MDMILSVKEVEHFKQQGYLIQEGVYTGSDLTLLRQGLTIAVQTNATNFGCWKMRFFYSYYDSGCSF